MTLLREKYVVITRKYGVLTRKDLVITRKYVVLTGRNLIKKDIIEWKTYVCGSITSP